MEPFERIVALVDQYSTQGRVVARREAAGMLCEILEVPVRTVRDARTLL